MIVKENNTLTKNILKPLVQGTTKPLTRLLDATGLYERLLHIAKNKIATARTQNNFGSYQPDEHDVLVCTYPKSGTNWMMQIAFQMIHRGEGEFEDLHQHIPWVDAIAPVPAKIDDESLAQESPFGMRVIKTHLSGEFLPYTSDAKYICILRDPKDVLVSSYFFVRDVALGVAMPSVQTWYKLFLSDAFFFGSWAQNLQDYWALRHHPNVMVITFEQMKADHMGTIRQVHDLLGLNLSEDEIQKVYEKSTFAYMKNIAHKFDPTPMTIFTGTEKAQMIRKGKSGGSSELLSIDQQRAIDDFCRTELKRIGSDFPYEEHFKLA